MNMSARVNAADLLTVVTFSIGRQRLAVPANALREIIDPLPMTRVPGAGAFSPWVLNVRGQVLPLAELRIPLGIGDEAGADANADTRRFLVLEVDIGGEPSTTAIVADIVHEVTTIHSQKVEPLPSSTIWPAEYVSGIYSGPDGFVLLPDLSSIFTSMAHSAAVI